MFHYYLDSGLSVVELCAKLFKNRSWYLPDFICDKILDKIKEHVNSINFYHVDDDLGWIEGNIPENSVYYKIDYFGVEGSNYVDSDVIVLNDSSWMPHPFSSVKSNQIWFNDFKKIFKNSMGSTIISPYRLPPNEVPGIFNHPNLTWQEVDIRFRNFHFCKKLLEDFQIDNFLPDFPTIFPFKLKNRDDILEKTGLIELLPSAWKNTYGLDNILYKELVLMPIDSRFDEQKLTDMINKIKDAING